MDSLSDSVATAAVLIATLVGRFTGLEIDGWCGVLVAAFILWSGINAVRDTLDPLLGTPPTHEFVQQHPGSGDGPQRPFWASTI